jgi:hypothetical protein
VFGVFTFVCWFGSGLYRGYLLLVFVGLGPFFGVLGLIIYNCEINGEASLLSQTIK